MQHFEVCRWQFVAVNGTLLCSGAGFDKKKKKAKEKYKEEKLKMQARL